MAFSKLPILIAISAALILDCISYPNLINLQLVPTAEAFQPVGTHRGRSCWASPQSCKLTSIISTKHSTNSNLVSSIRMEKLKRVHPLNLSSDNADSLNNNVDSLVLTASKRLTSASWLSWWSQLILTVVSSVTFVFARSVMDSQAVSPLEFSKVASKFILPGAGIVASILSIIWTWGGRRLARRFVRRTSTRVEAANLLRRVITVGVTINLIGLFTSLIGAQYIIGTLVAKAMQNVVGFGAGGIGGIASQTLQPLDVLVVQANTNVLLSHFVSLACLLWLTRTVDSLDPPSLEEDA